MVNYRYFSYRLFIKLISLRRLVFIVMFVGVLVFFGLFSFGCSKKPVLNSVRPEDCPDVLIVPEDAFSINYSTPSNSRCAPNTYHLGFMLREQYPAENIRNFFEKHLKSHGWRKLKYRLMGPELKAGNWTVDSLPDSTTQTRNWEGGWVNDKDDVILIFLEYSSRQTNENESNVLYVTFALYKKESIKGFLSRYKHFHPEEFSGSNDANETRRE